MIRRRLRYVIEIISCGIATLFFGYMAIYVLLHTAPPDTPLTYAWVGKIFFVLIAVASGYSLYRTIKEAKNV